MRNIIVRRLGASLLLLYLVLTTTFFIVHLTPGEPSVLFQDPRITPQQRQLMRQTFGLDQPLGRQYLLWMAAVSRGDWGVSFSAGRPAGEVLMEKMPNTCLLVAGTLLVEYSLGLALGLIAARRPGRLADRLIRVFSLLFWAMPSFWLALLAIELFTVQWPIFPTNQMTSDSARNLPPLAQALDVLHHLALPALILGGLRSGAVVRFVRNGLLEVTGQDYIRTARAKGLSAARVLWVHALRNAVIPVVQRFGTSLPILLSGTLIIEVIFAWPGIGQTVYWAMLQRDFPLILASTALSGVLVVLGSLAADLLHAWIDPRVRHGLA